MFSDNRGRLLKWFLFIQIGDVLTTYIGLRAGLHEVNPVARSLLMAYGEPAIYVLKAVGVALILGCLLVLGRCYARLGLALRVTNALGALVLLSNVLNLVLEQGMAPG